MQSRLKSLAGKFLPILDILLLPFVLISGIILQFVRRVGFLHLPISKKILLKIGVMPIRNHYYEPLFDEKNLIKPLSDNRSLPGIDWNLEEQFSLLNSFDFNSELQKIPHNYTDELSFHFKNENFEFGDAEFWYNIIRSRKPSRIIEIGSGHSTKMAQLAILHNKQVDSEFECEHICIEPYEMPWLEKLDITVIRQKVENVDFQIFNSLKANDILFIDSSHMIRPQGDVLFEYLELLPQLNSGVIVHIHDIFSPKDYPKEWIIDEVRFWNEQYLLEAFLTENDRWKIIGAINFLHQNHFDLLQSKCPNLTKNHRPGSFYIQKK